jgi:hypothetical protein
VSKAITTFIYIIYAIFLLEESCLKVVVGKIYEYYISEYNFVCQIEVIKDESNETSYKYSQLWTLHMIP